ncbi:MAG: energy-coupling factor transporter transmembrane protein EcfT [Lachnospiraceae bacterium]|nr:energy-coupling factor transporter transmembrane protein EcfT [Lachnospiraceae bacterium]
MKLNLTILKIISQLLDYDGLDKSLSRVPLQKVVPALRLFGVCFIILLCALSRNAYFTFIIIAIGLLHLSFLPVKDMFSVIRMVFTADLFSGLILLPSVFLGNPGTLFTVLMKVTESVMLLSTINCELEWKEITAAFRAFKVPSIFVLTLDMTVHFLVILGRFSDRLLEAVSLRLVGKKDWKSQSAGDILGTTFLKSTRIATKTSEAMVCRCFSGEYRSFKKHRFNIWDFLYVLFLILVFVLFLITRR